MAHFRESHLVGLNTVIRSGMSRHQVPGCAVAILQNGERFLASYGVTSVENPLEVTPSTLFQIGSITKTFTGLALAILQDDGRLDFDAPVRTYLPDFRVRDAAASATVTVRNLVTHTSGWIGDVFRDTGQGDDALAIYVARMADVPQQFAPGTNWSYNNAAFAVAGRVIEVVSGMPVERFLDERILQPLGMKQTRILAREVINQRVVSGHMWGGERGAQVARPWWKTRGTNAVGSIVSSVEDICHYLRFQLAESGVTAQGERLLSQAMLRATHAPQAQGGASYDATGYAWLLRTIGGARAYGHNGATLGQMANLLILPEIDLAFIILTNGQRGDALYGEASAWILREVAGVVDALPARQPRSEQELQTYVGRYRAARTIVDVTVEAKGLCLTTTPLGGYPKEDSPPPPAPPPAHAHFIGNDLIRVENELTEDARTDFLRDASGNIEWLRIGGRLHKRE